MRGIMCVVLIWGCVLGAQDGPPGPAFEVASVKHSQPIAGPVINGGSALRMDNAQAELRNLTLAVIVQIAYRLPPDQIKGPSWLQDDQWDIIGKLPAGSSSKQVPEMLQRLLAERFKILTHYKDKVLPVYDLVLGKGPLRLKESAGSDPAQKGCRGGPHHICQNTSMADLAAILTTSARLRSMAGPGMISWALDRPVIDKTGLPGAYDFTMDYGRTSPLGETDLAEVSIADAVKALGLALKPSTQPTHILMIDHIERVPSEN